MNSTSGGLKKLFVMKVLWMAMVMIVTMMMMMTMSTADEVSPKTQKNLVLLVNRRISKDTSTESLPATNYCNCKIMCMISLPCQHVLAEVLGEKKVMCYLFDHSFNYADVSDNTGSMIFYWTEYKQHLNAGPFYHIYETTLNRHLASRRCLEEGGQLAVVETTNRIDELKAFLRDHYGEGQIKVHWIGLIRTLNNNNQYNIDPSWVYRSGFESRVDLDQMTSVNFFNYDEPQSDECFHIHTLGENHNYEWRIANSQNCSRLSYFVCQKEF